MLESSTYWLVVLGMLLVYVCARVGLRDWAAFELRHHEEEAKRRARESQWPVASFDASTIAPQIQRVREAHFAALPPRPHCACYPKRLLAVAGRLLAGFSYFRHAVPAPDARHESDHHSATGAA